MSAALLDILGSFAANFLSDETRQRIADRSGRNSASAAGRSLESMVVPETAEEYVDSLGPEQLAVLRSALSGPGFRDLVRQATIALLNDRVDRDNPALREQIAHLLRLSGLTDVYLGTDAVLRLILVASAKALEETPKELRTSPNLLAAAADVAAAGVRNGEMLRRIESLHRLNGFARSLRESTVALHTQFRVSQVGRARLVKFDDLYIAPRIGLSSATSHMKASFQDEVAHQLRMVILGDPGAGKSTFATKLAHDVAADQTPGLEGAIPILLTVRQHTASLRQEHKTLLSYLEASCRRPHQLDPPPHALEYFLLNGQAMVIIDGVDELGDSAFRASFAEMVNAFAHRYPLVRMLVTSRLVGYAEAPLDSELFPVVEMVPFSREQVQEYTTRWFALDGTLSEEQSAAHVAAFMDESEEVSDLRANPLLLTLLCTLYSSTSYIPRNRPEVYQKCAELLFETWDRSRGLEVEYRFAAYIRPAVQHMAWHLFTDPLGRQALPRGEFQHLLADYLQGRRYEDREEALQAADDFLEFCTGRAWVLTDVGSDVLQPHYGFVHRTFLEYFAAAQLVRLKPDPSAVWERIRSHVDDPTWDVVNILAVQILDRTHEDGAAALLGAILDGLPNRNPSVANRAELNFAISSLECIPISTGMVRLLARRCVEYSSDIRLADRETLWSDQASDATGPDQDLIRLLKVCFPDNHQRIHAAVVDQLRDAVPRSDADSSAAFVYSLIAGLLPGFGESYGLDEKLTRTLAAEPPSEVTRLLTEYNRPPVATVLSSRGRALFAWTHLGEYRTHPPVRNLLDTLCPIFDTFEDRIQELVRLHDPMVAAFPFLVTTPGSSVPHDRTASVWRDSSVVTADLIDRLTPTARATALLIVAAGSRFGTLYTSPEDRIGAFVAARDVPSARFGARHLLENWAIPADARELLQIWIDNRDFRR